MQTVALPLESSNVGLSCSSVSAQMESPTATPYSDESPRTAKFLCSFGGSILPRPLDGRLRYVGGETRIVSVPHDISFSDFLSRMRELFEAVDVIKYQQPDEDLDALVSVVNDDDVMNMMEEYDKLYSSGEGYTRLRIFLFSQLQDTDASLVAGHYDVDERETERRYVDALNSLADIRSQSVPDYADQFGGAVNNDMGLPSSAALRHLNVPRASYGQKYVEVENSRSPALFSPGRCGIYDAREHVLSPSSARYQVVSEDYSERLTEELVRQLPNLSQYDYQSPPQGENIMRLPPGTVLQEKSGFPGNLSHSNSLSDTNTTCEQCRRTFQRGQVAITDNCYLDSRWRNAQAHVEQPNLMSDYLSHPIICPECCRSRDQCRLNLDVRYDSGLYGKDRDHQQICYTDSPGSDRGWHLHNQNSYQYDDPKLQLSGGGRIMDPYGGDSSAVNSPYVPCNMHFNNELGNDNRYRQQYGGGNPYMQASCLDETTGQHLSNSATTYVGDTSFQAQQNCSPVHSFLRKVHSPVRPTLPYELSNAVMPNVGVSPSFLKGTPDGVSPGIPGIVVYEQTQNQWTLQPDGLPQQNIVGVDAAASAANSYLHGTGLISIIPGPGQVVQPFFPTSSPLQPCIPLMEIHPVKSSTELSPPFLVDDKVDPSDSRPLHPSRLGPIVSQNVEMPNEKILHSDCQQSSQKDELVQHTFVEIDRAIKVDEPQQEKFSGEAGASATNDCQDISVGRFNFLPQLVASVQKVVLEDGDGEIKGDFDVHVQDVEEHKSNEGGIMNDDRNSETGVNGSCEKKKSKIETTAAEAEALAKGLQTINNEDLEEIRELGSGTYGSVYHGKWKGSDVAIKRIKASCFAGKPSERERLIADFWKEALILSSLHHPNVVSFYGVVRDGPDGSLATVTEFMVNGSLKQFLQKKDRTIDRRKRLILAMDASFGMEYLHGKNIVHFDLKCENLLVNMRDPHRPICKIGDLGLSKVKQHTLVSGGVRGTLPWMAPELLSGKSSMVSEKIDVYSFGIVMWELLTGDEPYAEMRCASIIGGIVNDTLRPQIPSWCDPEWKSLMESCWDGDPTGRPTFSEISQRLRKMAAAINVK